MSKYRPDGWERIVEDNCYDGDCVYRELDTFEDGADAMLEALRKDGIHLNKGDKWGSMPERGAGTLVFIPDSEYWFWNEE